MSVIGRFAPSPTGSLHLGNLRTALLAWLSARTGGGHMLVRIEDLDLANSSIAHEHSQVRDLARLGISHPDELVRQSERFDFYASVISDLRARDLVYPCYCSRREIREAITAPHGAYGHNEYPGTCRELTRQQQRDKESSGRPPALRLRTNNEIYVVYDRFAGDTDTSTDDFVLQRNDGVPSYNLAVVVDDELQGVSEVVRGDDLLGSTGRHLHLQNVLGYRTPAYIHVPLVLGVDGERLAKRHGAVTLDDLGQLGVESADVLGYLAESIGCRSDDVRIASDLLESFSWNRVPRGTCTIPNAWQTDPR